MARLVADGRDGDGDWRRPAKQCQGSMVLYALDREQFDLPGLSRSGEIVVADGERFGVFSFSGYRLVPVG